MSLPHSPNQNHLLAALPTEEYERLVAHLELVPMALGEILYEPGEQMRFAPKTGEALGILPDYGGQDFDSHVAPQLHIGRAPNLPHSSRSQGREDPVGAEALAGSYVQWTAEL